MYDQAKSCVKGNNQISISFPCDIGVRQGENLSPLLFALYLNDFENFISNKYDGLSMTSDNINQYLSDDDVEIYLKLYTLLYADDTIVLAESPSQLQSALNAVHDYCNLWKLTVNASKTKIVIFSRGKVRSFPTFSLGGNELEVVPDYVYLGVKLNYNGLYNKAINKQVVQARRALYGLNTKALNLNLPIDIHCQLFDQVVTPVLLYGCEIDKQKICKRSVNTNVRFK